MCPMVLRHILQARSRDPLFLDTAGKGGRGVTATRLRPKSEACKRCTTRLSNRRFRCFNLQQSGLNRLLTQQEVVRILLPMWTEIKGIKL